MNWQGLLEFFGGAAAISATFAFLGKKAIEVFLTAELKPTKASWRE